MKKIVLTGAAGRLGSYLREPLSKMCDELLSTDITDGVGDTLANETFVQADLGSMEQINPLLEGADMVVHFGAFVDEGPFEQLLGPNFVGSYNIWESAKLHGVRRVIYASSIHAVGMYPKTDYIDVNVPHRPDTFYGLAKCFTEDLGRMYWEKEGLESVHLRIYSAASVNNPRSLGTYLSYDDLIQLVQRSIEAPVVGFTIAWGVSNNDRGVVDRSRESFLGYRPKDNAEDFYEQAFENPVTPDPTDLAQMRHGGAFAAVKLGNSGLANMTVVDKPKES
jgi:uronate dehydrogenase